MNTRNLIVARAPGKSRSSGLIRFGLQTWPCLLGKNGITTRKVEGDMKTPAGKFPLLFAYHNKSRIPFLNTALPVRTTYGSDGWCDDPFDPNYNRPITLPYRSSHEKLQRNDHLYDLIIVMDHNYTTRIRGRGSAVFFHLTDKNSYTAGCVAISKTTMLNLLPMLSRQTHMIIKA